MNFYKCNRFVLFVMTHLIIFSSCSFNKKDHLPAISDDYLVNTIGIETIASVSTKLLVMEGQIKSSGNIEKAVQPIGLSCFFSLTRVPSTLVKTDNTETYLSLILVGQKLPKNAVAKVIPIAILTVSTKGTQLPIVIAVPADPDKRMFPAEDFASMEINHPELLKNIEQFFSSPGLPDEFSFLWQGEQEAYRLIKSCSLK